MRSSDQLNVHRGNRCQFLGKAVKSQGLGNCDDPICPDDDYRWEEECLTHVRLPMSTNET